MIWHWVNRPIDSILSILYIFARFFYQKTFIVKFESIKHFTMPFSSSAQTHVRTRTIYQTHSMIHNTFHINVIIHVSPYVWSWDIDMLSMYIILNEWWRKWAQKLLIIIILDTLKHLASNGIFVCVLCVCVCHYRNMLPRTN